LDRYVMISMIEIMPEIHNDRNNARNNDDARNQQLLSRDQ